MTEDTKPAAAFGHGVKQRDLIKMTPQEADEFIRGWHTMNCATMKAGACPSLKSAPKPSV